MFIPDCIKFIYTYKIYQLLIHDLEIIFIIALLCVHYLLYIYLKKLDVHGFIIAGAETRVQLYHQTGMQQQRLVMEKQYYGI